jgi:hypothetical protein
MFTAFAGDRDYAWTVDQFRALPPPFFICDLGHGIQALD